MEQVGKQQSFQNTPNLISICVDDIQHGELAGRLYHCYSETPFKFTNAVRLVELAENLFDMLQFPQASTKMRTFSNDVRPQAKSFEKKLSVEEIEKERGKKGTILLYVQYRQRSTWQGEVKWVEGNRQWKFFSELELFKIIHQALQY